MWNAPTLYCKDVFMRETYLHESGFGSTWRGPWKHWPELYKVGGVFEIESV